ncbi:hypothetical protein NW754_010929 [Fusarium falciforme]|nr:hypothetical protein NW754_010929 [Fusarium falciforme]
MRETSKAFDLFSWDNFPEASSITHVQELMTKLQEAYSLPDVYEFGQNTANLCIMRYGVLLDYSTSSEESSLLLHSLETLLSFLSEAVQVDIFVGENHNGYVPLWPNMPDPLNNRN